MHELSIVQDLFKLCETNAFKYNGTKITRVEVQVGKLSGVEPHYLQSTFEAFKEGTICSDAQLVIEEQDIIVTCQDCDFSGSVEANEFVCPICGKNNLSVVSGEELMLMRLEIE